MKFTLNWLSEYIDITTSLEKITQKLTAIGFEVEEVVDRAKILADFTIAEIIETYTHPNADKLKVCKVNNGHDILQIVCGAHNARSGIKVVLAPVGAIIPANGMTIKKSKIRDIESCGMLCSASELMIGEGSDGIIEVSQNMKIGDNYAKSLSLDEVIFDIAVTPNRGDCLGVYGVARELAAAGCGNLKMLKFESLLQTTDLPIAFKIETNLCKAYLYLYVSNIKNLIIPKQYNRRLEECGFNLHSPIINLTNYITHSFNRPVHVFDVDKLNGDIKITKAKYGQKFQALNNVEYILNDGDIIIETSDEIIALAGILGSKNSAVTENTNNVLIEVAAFDDIAIAKTGRKHNIVTDARYRFERKLDDANLNNMADLIAGEIQKFSPKSIISKNSILQNLSKRTLDFDLNLVNKLLGFDIDYEIIINILSKLGFKIIKQDYYLKLTIPSWRNDITIAEDILEEIIRIYGFDKIEPLNLDKSDSNIIDQSNSYTLLNKVRILLSSRGLDEIISWSFISKTASENFGQINKNLIIVNPVSSEFNYMRPSIVPGILDIIGKNSKRGFNNLSLFEIGNIFLDIGNEVKTICSVRSGKKFDKNIYKESRDFDVLDIKADLAKVLELLGYDINNFILNYNVANYLHPYRSANLLLGKNLIGYFGQIHPDILSKYDIKFNINVFEIYLNNLPNKVRKKSKYIKSDYQVVKRDFAFILPIEQEVGSLIKLIKSVNSKLIKDVKVFDIYQGEKLEYNKKSVAFNIVIQADDHTFTELEITVLSKEIENIVVNKLNGKLRD